MSPRERSILETLHLLVLVFRAQKDLHPSWDELQKHTLQITTEHLELAKLSAPVFLNTLLELNKKGYLFAFSVFEKKYLSEL